MRITGSVPEDEVPQGASPRRRGVWQELVEQAMQDHRAGRTTMVELADYAEYKRLRNSTQAYWSQNEVWVNPSFVEQPNGKLLVYLKLEDRNPKPTVIGRPRGRPRKAQ